MGRREFIVVFAMEACGSVGERRSEEEGTLSLQTRQTLNEMRELGQLTDAVLEAEGARFPVHRAIMASASPFFRALFTNGFKETHSAAVQLTDVPAAVLRDIIHFAYVRRLHISKDNVTELFNWADYLDLPRLRDQCADYLKRHLNAHNCVEIWCLSQRHRELREAAWDFLVRNFETVATTTAALMQMNGQDMVRLLEEDALNCHCEETAYKLAQKWLNWDKEQRAKDAGHLLRRVRVACLQRTQLEEMVHDRLVSSSAALKELIASSLKLVHGLRLDSQELMGLMETRACRPRLPSEVLMVVGGWSGGSPTSVVETYDVRTRRWTEVPLNDPTGPRAYHALVVLRNKVYMMGGFNGAHYFNSVREFDPIRKLWMERGPMNAKRCYVSAATVDGKVFAMGGFNGQVRTNSAECYNPEKNQWTYVTPMNVQRSDAHAAAIGGKIYICGGFNGHDCMDTVEVYEPGENRWRQVRTMSTCRSGVGVAELDGVLYALGGFNGAQRLDTVERYDPRVDCWEWLSTMDVKRSNFSVDSCEGRLYVAGGFNGATTIANAECFEPRLNCWTRSPSMNLHRSALYMCRLEHLPNVREFLGSRDLPFSPQQ